MNKSSISQIPQCIRQITHNAPFSKIFLLQNGALWYRGLVHCGICTMGLLISQKFVFGCKSEFLGIKRSWIKKTLPLIWRLDSYLQQMKMHFSTILGQDLHRGPKRAFLTLQSSLYLCHLSIVTM